MLNETDRQFAIASRWLPADRIDVVPHGVSDRFLGGYRAAAPRGAGALFCGAWDRVKGTPYLVGAFQRLAEQDRPVPLTILGCGIPPADVLASLPEVLRPHVTIVDRVSEEEVVAQYRRHDLLVFPSTYEGFGLVVLEAMSQGLPVIATPVGCVPDLVRDGDTGVIVPLRDSAALAEAVTRLMASPDSPRAARRRRRRGGGVDVLGAHGAAHHRGVREGSATGGITHALTRYVGS